MCYLRYSVLFMLFSHTIGAAAEISINNAWINEAPPGVKVLAAYMTIVNNGTEEIRLVKADSNMFEKIEFHVTQMNDGVASMHRQDSISIPDRSSFSFSPGGYHLMLFNPGSQLRSGDIVPVELTFSNGVILQVEAGVRRGEIEHSH